MKWAITKYDFAPQISHWQQWAQLQGCCQTLGTKVLAVGIASALATFAPMKADAVIQTVNQEVSLINQPVDMEGDGIPDVLCMAGEDTDADNWTNTNYLYCYTFGGARIWGNANACLSVTADVAQIKQLSTGGSWQAVCQLSASVDDEKLSETGSSTGPSTKTLGIRTSSKKYGFINVVINAANTDVKMVSRAYEVLPIDNLTATPNNGQILLSWDNKSDSETVAIEIYRNGQLIAKPLANATFYTDDQLPQQCGVTYTYVTKVINRSGDVFQTAPVSIKPNCSTNPNPPLSRLFIKVDGNGECAGRVTTTPNVGIDCASSDCQQINGEIVPNCKPAKCSAGLDQLGETITLNPHPETTGCEFSNWGGHNDCANGELTVTMDNKMCIAYFGVPSQRGLLGMPRTPTLPSLGNGMEICPDSQPTNTTAQFNGGVSVNGGEYQREVTAKTSDQLKIRGLISMDSQHRPLTTDIFVYASHQATGQGKRSYLMVDENNHILWDENLTHLVPLRKDLSFVKGTLDVDIFNGQMLASGLGSGRVEITFGYWLENGTIVYSSQPIVLNVIE